MTVPLHAHSGSHHLFLFIGSPQPQRQTLILDTGSRYTAFPCEPWCRNCGKHTSQKFNGTKSTTLKHNEYPNCVFTKKQKDPLDNACVFDQIYLEGSGWTAREMEDFLWLGTGDYQETLEEYMPRLAMPFVFGCQTSVKGNFRKQYADGILGLARFNEDNAFLKTMVRSKAIDRAAFSTCLTREGGTFSLGGSGLARADSITRQQHLEPMLFTNIASQENHFLYSLQVDSVSVGPICITCLEEARNREDERERQSILDAFRADKKVLLDTGTTDTFFPRVSYRLFSLAWTALSGKSKMLEVQRYTYDEYRQLPDVTLVFAQNATLVIPPSSYMDGLPLNRNSSIPGSVAAWSGSRRLTLRLYFEEKSGAVLGSNAMLHYDVLYDLEESRIGFAHSHCG